MGILSFLTMIKANFKKNGGKKSVTARYKLRLVEQQGADREMLGVLGMKDSPSYSFSCDIIHQLENYVQVSNNNHNKIMINLTYFRYFTLFWEIKGGMKSLDQRIPN
jgi:hypothetical protein